MAASPAVLASSPFRAAALPLCAHCGLPVTRGSAPETEALYCCSGCALAHRLTGGAAGHGQAAGMLMAVGIGAFFAMNVMMLSFVLYSGRGEADRAAGEAWVRIGLLALATPALVLLGGPFLTRGARRLRARRLDTDVLIVLGVSAAFALSARSVFLGYGPLFLDTAMGILLFVTIGRYLEAASRARTTDALAALVRQMPEWATLVRGGREERVRLADLRAGDLVRVRPGERLPVDGVVREGEGSVAEAEITGESLPAARGPGDAVAAGTLNLDGSLLVEARRTGMDTTFARIVRLVEAARAGGYPLAPLVDRISKVFVPVVLILALGTLAFWTHARDAATGIMNALAVLLIACPCAIGIATPLAASAAAGRAAAGVLVRSGEVFERLARSRRVFFDKTGTLTSGALALVGLRPASGVSEDELLRLAIALEHHSEHPIAAAVRDAATERGLAVPPVSAFRVTPGRGVSGQVGQRTVRLGTAAFAGDAPEVREPGASVVHATVDGRWQGALVFRDAPRPSAADAVREMQAQSLEAELLSGDQAEAVASFAQIIPGLVARAALSPEDKVTRVEQAVRAGEMPVMVGDGINDAPALSRAAVGVTLESGTDLARESADVTIRGGDLRRLPWLLRLSRRTLLTARLNLFWAFFYNGIGLVLAILGLLHPLFGAVAMIASSLLVALHSQRLSHHPLPGSLP